MDLSFRKSVFLGVSLGIVLLFAIPCATWLLGNLREWAGYPDYWKRRQEEKAFMRPAPQLPIRSDDYRRFPREGFGFVIVAPPWYRINSFEGTMTTRVRSGRDTTIALPFTPSEMDSIYREMIAVRIFDLEEPHPPVVTESDFRTHNSDTASVRVEVRAGAAVKHFSWSFQGRIVRRPDNWKRLTDWMYLIEQIAVRKPAFRALPRPIPPID